MRISEQSLVKLQEILKQQTSKEYDSEQAQKAGRAILRFMGIRLYQQFEKEVQHAPSK